MGTGETFQGLLICKRGRSMADSDPDSGSDVLLNRACMCCERESWRWIWDFEVRGRREEDKATQSFDLEGFGKCIG